MGKMKSFYYDDPEDFSTQIRDFHLIKRQQAMIEDLREQIEVLECEVEDLVIAQAQKKYT